MRAYVVKGRSPFFDWGKRVGDLHETVYHGVGYYPSKGTWKPVIGIKGRKQFMQDSLELDERPGITNENREVLHISRSGRFLPKVFCTSILASTFVLSPDVQKALASLPNLAFNDVAFEHLVDLPMPDVGDFSWYKRTDLDKYEALPDVYLWSLPHVAEFEKRVEGYKQLLPANYHNIAQDYTDIKSVKANFGSYHSSDAIKKLDLSRKMLEKYPIIQTPTFIFREDAFAAIAPYLDLDYFGIAVLTLT